jgi:hypothetical protein
MGEQDDESCRYFFRRLTIARAVIPTMTPTIIDSHGKPGIAGSTIGVETEIVVELLVVVGMLVTVTVDSAADVEVVELVMASEVVDSLDDDELALDEEVVAAVELELEFVVVACCPTTGGIAGSRWKMPVRVCTPVLGCAPTAQPSVGFVVKTE